MRLAAFHPGAALLLSASILASVLVSTSAAQGTTKRPPAGYTEAIREALSEFELGNFPESREQFRKAHAIDPNGRTFRGLGVVEFELRHYVESVELLEQALAAKHKPLEGKLRVETEAALERARAYVGEIQIETEPQTATVLVDGEVFERGTSNTLRLDVGDHVLEFHAAGRLTTKQTVSVKGGKTEAVRVVLRELQEAPAPQPTPTIDLKTPPPAKAESEPLYTKWWLWTAVGVVVAAGATTGVILLTRDPEERTVPFVTKNTPAGATFQTLSVTGP